MRSTRQAVENFKIKLEKTELMLLLEGKWAAISTVPVDS